jgi:hypothetical protein
MPTTSHCLAMPCGFACACRWRKHKRSGWKTHTTGGPDKHQHATREVQGNSREEKTRSPRTDAQRTGERRRRREKGEGMDGYTAAIGCAGANPLQARYWLGIPTCGFGFAARSSLLRSRRPLGGADLKPKTPIQYITLHYFRWRQQRAGFWL